MWPHPQETADLVTFTRETLNGKLHYFVRSDSNDDSETVLNIFSVSTKLKAQAKST